MAKGAVFEPKDAWLASDDNPLPLRILLAQAVEHLVVGVPNRKAVGISRAIQSVVIVVEGADRLGFKGRPWDKARREDGMQVLQSGEVPYELDLSLFNCGFHEVSFLNLMFEVPGDRSAKRSFSAVLLPE